MKLDTHVHTQHSGYSTIKPLRRIMREAYNTPRGVYRMTKERGMDLVTITDHDLGEERFNRDLLFDLVAQPARVLRAVPELAA